ncbi:unnamed protein product [Discosporangium mesarthrocarpum]
MAGTHSYHHVGSESDPLLAPSAAEDLRYRWLRRLVPPITRGTAFAAGIVIALTILLPLVRSPSVSTFSTAVETGASFKKTGDKDSSLRVRERDSDSRLYGNDVVVEDKQPNVIFILIDDLGWGDIGYQSSDLSNLTPNLDAMAAKGVKLDNYYTSNICTPARASLLTGRHPYRYGMQLSFISPEAPWGLPLDEITMANRYKDAGYDTHMVGKWHLGYYTKEHHPINRGFDSFLGFLGGDETYSTHEWCSHDHYSKCFYDFGYADDKLDGLLDPSTNKTWLADEFNGSYSTTVFTDRVVNITRKTVEDAAGEGVDPNPMFIYLPTQVPHRPLEPPPNGSFTDDDHIELALATNASVSGDRHTFAMMLYFLDKEVGRLMTELSDTGVLDDAVVVVASDNGACIESGGSNFPFRGFKNSYFQGGVRVPAFVYSESRIPKEVQGTTYSGLMHVVDWIPTLAGLSRLSLSGKGLDGINHWDAMLGLAKGSPGRTELMLGYEDFMWETDEGVTRSRPRGSIIQGHWKLIVQEWCMAHRRQSKNDEVPQKLCGNEGECTTCNLCYDDPEIQSQNYLFNLKGDPTEMVNLIDQHPDIAESLLNHWTKIGTRDAIPSIYHSDDPSAAEVKGLLRFMSWLCLLTQLIDHLPPTGYVQ